MALTPFHIAVQVRDIAEARRFYGGVLGCPEGRSDRDWVDFNLFGHQFVCHLNPNLGSSGRIGSHYNPVDDHAVPVPHCGVVLEMPEWERLAERLNEHGVRFVVEPYVRFKGQPGEQATLSSSTRPATRSSSNRSATSSSSCSRLPVHEGAISAPDSDLRRYLRLHLPRARCAARDVYFASLEECLSKLSPFRCPPSA